MVGIRTGLSTAVSLFHVLFFIIFSTVSRLGF